MQKSWRSSRIDNSDVCGYNNHITTSIASRFSSAIGHLELFGISLQNFDNCTVSCIGASLPDSIRFTPYDYLWGAVWLMSDNVRGSWQRRIWIANSRMQLSPCLPCQKPARAHRTTYNTNMCTLHIHKHSMMSVWQSESPIYILGCWLCPYNLTSLLNRWLVFSTIIDDEKDSKHGQLQNL